MIKYDSENKDYYFDKYVNSYNNERIVELRLSMDYYEEIYSEGKNNILEIGNVLGFYGYCEHECIDKFAQSDDISRGGTVDNIDALDYDYTGRNVISISTIEHIGMKDYNNPTANDGLDAITALDKIRNESKTFFITFGPNHNKNLDEYVKGNLDDYDWHGWCRTGKNQWQYTEQDIKVWDMKHDDPYEFANGIILLREKS